MLRMVRAEPLPPGTRLGNWVLAQAIGGSRWFSTVYQAHGSDGRAYAIKEYTPARAGVSLTSGTDPASVRQGLHAFAADAHGLSTLASPNRTPGLVAVSELLKANGTVYAVMNFERGTPLSQILGRGDRPDEQWLMAMLSNVAKGLTATHDIGVLHRAIRPADIIIAPDGEATLVGFCSRPGLVSPEAFFDDPYAAPEQRWDGLPIGFYTDVYALGMTLRRCVTGTEISGEPLSERAWPGFSRQFLTTIDAATSTDISRRPMTVADWLDRFPPAAPVSMLDLDRATSTLTDASVSPIGLSTITITESTGQQLPDIGAAASTNDRKLDRKASTRRPIWAAIGTLTLLLGSAIALVLNQSHKAAIDLQALDRDLRTSRATVQAIDLDTRQVLLDGVSQAQARPELAMAAQVHSALARKLLARSTIDQSKGREEQQALLSQYSAAGVALDRAEVDTLRSVMAAYGAEVEQRSHGFDGAVRDVRLGVSKLSDRSGDEIASRIDTVWPLFTQSRFQLERLLTEPVTSVGNARQLLGEIKLVYHANSEARANLDGLVSDAKRVIQNEKIDGEVRRAVESALEGAITQSRTSARTIATLSGKRLPGGSLRLARLTADAQQRVAGLAFLGGAVVDGDLPTLRTALAEARVAEATLRSMLAEARGIQRASSRLPRAPAALLSGRATDRVPARAPGSAAPAIVRRWSGQPTVLRTDRDMRDAAQKSAREVEATFNHYRDLRRELKQAYRARGTASPRNVRDFVEVDEVYAAILHMRELKRIADGAKMSAEAEQIYRQFDTARQNIEIQLKSLRRNVAER